MAEQKLSEIRQPTTFEEGVASPQSYDRQPGYGGVAGPDIPAPFYGPQGMSSEMPMNLVPPLRDVNAQQYSNQQDRGNVVSLVTMDSNIPRNYNVSPTTDYQPTWSIQGGQGDANAQHHTPRSYEIPTSQAGTYIQYTDVMRTEIEEEEPDDLWQHNPQGHKEVEPDNEGYDATQSQYNVVTNPMHRFPARQDMRPRNAQARPLDAPQQHQEVQLSAYIAHAGELARAGRPAGVERRRAIPETGDELAGISRDQQRALMREWWSGGQQASGGGERSVQAPTRREVEKSQKDEMSLMEQNHTAAQNKLTKEYYDEIARFDTWSESNPVAYPAASVEAWKQEAYQNFSNKWNDLVSQQAEEKQVLEQRHQARINLEWGE
jgi:hypothetical protein